NRRRILFETAIASMRTYGSVSTPLDAVRSVFTLDHHESDSDPADPRTIRFRHSLLGLQTAKHVFEMWKPFLEAAKTLPAFPWSAVHNLSRTGCTQIHEGALRCPPIT